ncbi:MAG: hypothetical protein NVS1B6_13880 [Steroidobacteraceae bacterium]
MDQVFAQKYGFTTRPDLFKLRDIIAQKGFSGLLNHVKNVGYAGFPVAAGAALLPYLRGRDEGS